MNELEYQLRTLGRLGGECFDADDLVRTPGLMKFKRRVQDHWATRLSAQYAMLHGTRVELITTAPNCANIGLDGPYSQIWSAEPGEVFEGEMVRVLREPSIRTATGFAVLHRTTCVVLAHAPFHYLLPVAAINLEKSDFIDGSGPNGLPELYDDLLLTG